MREPPRPASAVMYELGPGATKADRIRALHREGYSRSEIAEAMGIRYQHVRNVLVDDERLKQNSTAPRTQGMTESKRPLRHAPDAVGRIVVGKSGRITLPREVLVAIGAKEGDVLLVRSQDGEIRLTTPAEALRRVQAHVRQFVPEGVSLADELIQERRREAKRELEDD